MTSPYDKILTGVGLIKDSKLTLAAKNKFIDETTTLLVTGNADGKGGSTSFKMFNSLVALPPFPGPSIVNVTTFESESLFWFAPDPFAALSATQIKGDTSSIWRKIFFDILYEKTAVALDIAGSTPLFPVFDPSSVFPEINKFPITIPELASQLKLTPPSLLLKLADLGIKLQPPQIPIPPLPLNSSIPTFNVPNIPGLPAVPQPPIILLPLMTGLVKIPFDVILNLIANPPSLVANLPNLPKMALSLAMTAVTDLMVSLNLNLTVPKVFVASILVYIKNIVGILCTVLVGSILGAGGVMTKSIAGLTGLI